jgi:hypothetical protein
MFELHPPGTFRLCAEPAFEAYAARQLRRVIDAVVQGLPGFAPLGVILVGSAARGEALLVADGRRTRWLSDLQCLVVVPDGARKWRAALAAALAGTAARLETEANAHAVGLRIRLSAASATRLATKAPPIFGCELAAHGKLVWGRPEAIAVPALPLDDYASLRRDAFRLLNDRIMEQVALRARYEDGWADAVESGYALSKYWTELATSLSMYLGCYRPVLRERMLAVEAALVARPETQDAVVGNGLLRKLDDATRVRLGKLEAGEWPCAADFDDSVRFAESLWLLESTGVASARADEDDTDWRIIARRMRRAAGLPQIIKDWARWLLSGNGSAANGPRAAGFTLGAGSPANAIYAAGCLLHFYWRDLGAADGSRMEMIRKLRSAFGARASWGVPLRRELAARAVAAWRNFLPDSLW